jgi:hypothetical protein
MDPDMLIGDMAEWFVEDLDRRIRKDPKARQAWGVDNPSPRHITQVEEAAEKFCELVRYSPKEEWRQIGRLVHAGIFGDGPPAHRPPSPGIAKRNADIIECIEFGTEQGRKKKELFSNLAWQWGLSVRAVKKIWDERERKDTEVPT